MEQHLREAGNDADSNSRGGEGPSSERTEAGEDLCELPPSVVQLNALEANVGRLENQFQTCRTDTAREVSSQVQAIWQELGEEPEMPRDAAVQQLGLRSAASDTEEPCAGAALGGKDDQTAKETEKVLTSVEQSLRAWEARRAKATEELVRLHCGIRALGGAPEVVEPFLAKHCSLHKEDLIACRTRLQKLQEAAHRAEAFDRQCHLNIEKRERAQCLAAAQDPIQTFHSSIRVLREQQREMFAAKGRQRGGG